MSRAALDDAVPTGAGVRGRRTRPCAPAAGGTCCPRLQHSLDHPVADADVHRSDTTAGQLPVLGGDLCLEVCWPGTTTPCLVAIIEVQLAIDKRKPPSWFAYQASQHYRTHAPALLVVVTNSHDVAQWARGPFWSGPTWLRPLVVGPGDLPAITDPEEARQYLPLAFLSGIVHGLEMTAVPIGLALAHAIEGSSDEDLDLYWDAFLASLDEAVRKELEMLLQRGNWQPHSEWGRGFSREARRLVSSKVSNEVSSKVSNEVSSKVSSKASNEASWKVEPHPS